MRNCREMPAPSHDAARLRALLAVARAAASARAVGDLIRLAVPEIQAALGADSVTVEVAPGEPSAHLPPGRTLQVPVLVDGRGWGRLIAQRGDGQRPFGPGDVDFATAIASQMAVGVSSAEHIARMERLAFEDALTGVSNRRAMDDRLEVDVAAHVADGRSVGLVLADINRLKQTNDAFGHEAGDRLIVAVAGAVSRAAALAPGSLSARIGGDEFCIVVTGEPEEVTVTVAGELCRLVSDLPMRTGVACGVATTWSSPSIDSPGRLLRLADAAQYRAKRSGDSRPSIAGRDDGADLVDPGARDRRTRRGRQSEVLARGLVSGLDLLDSLAGASAQERLEGVADHVRSVVDAAAWFLSTVDLATGDIHVADRSVQRRPETGASIEGLVGAQYNLRDFPQTERAVRTWSSFAVERGAPDNDPSEETELAAVGYHSVIGAGAGHGGTGWLLEIFGDSLSLAVGEGEDLLRVLVAVAVGGSLARLPGLPGGSGTRGAD